VCVHVCLSNPEYQWKRSKPIELGFANSTPHNIWWLTDGNKIPVHIRVYKGVFDGFQYGLQ
jgi:hypothetical protein